MIKNVIAVLMAAAVAVPAQAADFLVYTFNVFGTGNLYRNDQGGNTIRQNVPVTSQYVYFLPLSQVVATPTGQLFQQTPPFGQAPGTYDPSQSTFSVSGTTLSLVASFSDAAAGGRNSYTAALSLCGAFAGRFPTTSFAVDPLCSSAQSSSAGRSPTFLQGGQSQSFMGAVDRVDVTEGFGAPPSVGLSLLPTTPVPEPRTWALMIIGFGGIGAMLRRGRPRRAAVAATA